MTHPASSPACAVDALVLVDISPRWLYGHTGVDAAPPASFQTWVDNLGHLTRRLHATARYLEERQPRIPLITVETTSLAWLRMRRCGMTLALAGLYGDACVQHVAARLQTRGHAVVVVRDLCVWDEFPVADYPVPVCGADELWPSLSAWIADNCAADPVTWDGQPLWTGKENVGWQFVKNNP